MKSKVESITFFFSWRLKGKKRVVTQNNFPILTKSLTTKNELEKSSQGWWAIHNSEVQQDSCKGHCCSPSSPLSLMWLVQQTSACVGWRNAARQAHSFWSRWNYKWWKSFWKPVSQPICGNVGRGYPIKGKFWTAQCNLQDKHCSLSLWKWMIPRPDQDSQSLSLPLPANWLTLETSAAETLEPRLWCWWEIVSSQSMLSFHWYSISLSTPTQTKHLQEPTLYLFALCFQFNFRLVLKLLIK